MALVILLASDVFVYAAPNALMTLTNRYDPPMLRGIKLDNSNPLRFEFILDEGASRLTRDQLEAETKRLIGYFLCGLAIPEKELWVNLAPGEANRVAPASLGQTGLGEDMLEEDYSLKQLAASLTHPETEAGRKYWEEVNPSTALRVSSAKALPSVMTSAQPSLAKVWIVPQSATIYADNSRAYIESSHLGVNVEDGSVSARALKENILPLIEKEVNENKTFVRLRQMYISLLLATWFKKHLKENILNSAYADKKKLGGIEASEAEARERVYNDYLTALKQGAYDYVKRELPPTPSLVKRGSVFRGGVTRKIITRRYFSGGVAMAGNIGRVVDIGEKPFLQNLQGADVTTAVVDLSPDKKPQTVFVPRPQRSNAITFSGPVRKLTRKEKAVRKEALKNQIESLGVKLDDYKYATEQQLQDVLLFVSQIKPYYREGIRLNLASRYFHPLNYLFHKQGILGRTWKDGKDLVFLVPNRQDFLFTLVHEFIHVMTFKNKQALDKITSYTWDGARGEDHMESLTFDPSRAWSLFTAYSAKSPMEDAAEAGAVAVLQPQAARGNKVWEEKIKTIQDEFFVPGAEGMFLRLRKADSSLINVKRAGAISLGVHVLAAAVVVSPALAFLMLKVAIVVPFALLVYFSNKLGVGAMRLFSGKGVIASHGSLRVKLNQWVFSVLHGMSQASFKDLRGLEALKYLSIAVLLASIGVMFMRDRAVLFSDFKNLSEGRLPERSFVHKLKPAPMVVSAQPSGKPGEIDLPAAESGRLFNVGVAEAALTEEPEGIKIYLENESPKGVQSNQPAQPPKMENITAQNPKQTAQEGGLVVSVKDGEKEQHTIDLGVDSEELKPFSSIVIEFDEKDNIESLFVGVVFSDQLGEFLSVGSAQIHGSRSKIEFNSDWLRNGPNGNKRAIAPGKQKVSVKMWAYAPPFGFVRSTIKSIKFVEKPTASDVEVERAYHAIEKVLRSNNDKPSVWIERAGGNGPTGKLEVTKSKNRWAKVDVSTDITIADVGVNAAEHDVINKVIKDAFDAGKAEEIKIGKYVIWVVGDKDMEYLDAESKQEAHAGIRRGVAYIARGAYLKHKSQGTLLGLVVHELTEVQLWRAYGEKHGIALANMRGWIKANLPLAQILDRKFHALAARKQDEVNSAEFNPGGIKWSMKNITINDKSTKRVENNKSAVELKSFNGLGIKIVELKRGIPLNKALNQ